MGYREILGTRLEGYARGLRPGSFQLSAGVECLRRCLVQAQKHPLPTLAGVIALAGNFFFYVAQAGFQLLGSIIIPVSASQVTGPQACTTVLSLLYHPLTLLMVSLAPLSWPWCPSKVPSHAGMHSYVPTLAFAFPPTPFMKWLPKFTEVTCLRSPALRDRAEAD